jgi:hypothetical protein
VTWRRKNRSLADVANFNYLRSPLLKASVKTHTHTHTHTHTKKALSRNDFSAVAHFAALTSGRVYIA